MKDQTVAADGRPRLCAARRPRQMSEVGLPPPLSEEIERRLAELDADRVKLVPWDEVKAKLMRHTGAERQD